MITTSSFYILLSLIILIEVFAIIFLRKKSNTKETLEPTPKHLLTRMFKNPALSPRQHLPWEKEGVLNPAAIELDGKIHLLYRAIGADGISRVGYASSKDGFHFDEVSTYPIFAFEKPRLLYAGVQKFDPIMYPSGGSFGGVEDPRVTLIDGIIYMTFNAFDGWDFIRIGLTMISEQDFLKKRWSAWSKPILLSPPGEVHKNWMIFPEKINDKFAVLHSISPKVEIEYRTSLNTIGTRDPFIKSPVGARVSLRKDGWEARIRGAGAPPLKTEKGWLVLYHAAQHGEPHIGYKIGAMLLDLNDPTKVIAQSALPILQPDEWYENDWKAGVVYVCGAIIREDNSKGNSLYVYYGGGDKHVCIAHTNLERLLSWMERHGSLEEY